MRKLEKLRIERAIISNLSMIPASAKNIFLAHIAQEIRAINEYGADNPEKGIESLEAIRNILNENIK